MTIFKGLVSSFFPVVSAKFIDKKRMTPSVTINHIYVNLKALGSAPQNCFLQVAGP